jgi:hypothetical protein
MPSLMLPMAMNPAIQKTGNKSIFQIDAGENIG